MMAHPECPMPCGPPCLGWQPHQKAPEVLGTRRLSSGHTNANHPAPEHERQDAGYRELLGMAGFFSKEEVRCQKDFEKMKGPKTELQV